MKKIGIFVTLVLTIGLSVWPSVEGFIPNKYLAFTAKTLTRSSEYAIIHPEMTRNAILAVAIEVLRDNPNPRDRQGSTQRISALTNLDEKSLITAYYGLCDSKKKRLFEGAVEAVQDTNSGVDFGKEAMLAAAHFDAEQFESGQNRLIEMRQSVVSSIQQGDYDAARRVMGRMLHTLQDFYSHSNWVENGNQAPNPVLGQPGKIIENVADQEQRTCTDCASKTRWGREFYECENNIIETLKDNGILTSGYVGKTKDENGERIKKPEGKCSHGGLQHTDSEQNEPARGGINKDSPYQIVSPHYYHHYEAAALAQQATINMLRDLRRDVNNDQLFGEYLGVFESGASAERNSGPLAYSDNRNAMLQRHWNRIDELNTNFEMEDGDSEVTVAEMAELMAKMKHLYQQESWAKRAQRVAKRSPSQQESNENENVFSGAVPIFPLLPMELLMMAGSVMIFYFF